MSHCHGAAWRVGQDVRLTAARSGFDPGDRRFLAYISGFFVARLGFVSLSGRFSSEFWISRCSPVAEQRGALVKMFASRRRAPGSSPEMIDVFLAHFWWRSQVSIGCPERVFPGADPVFGTLVVFGASVGRTSPALVSYGHLVTKGGVPEARPLTLESCVLASCGHPVTNSGGAPGLERQHPGSANGPSPCHIGDQRFLAHFRVIHCAF